VAAVDQFEQGVLAIIMSGHAPKVKKDAFLGAFRVRSEVSTPIHHWQVSCVGGPEGIPVNRADALITHFKDQGGESGQALRKGAQVAAATVMQQVPILGLFAPKVEADVRYWSTLPGDVCVAYLPTEPGLHTVRATAFDKKNRGLDNYRQTWYYIPVSPEENTVLVIISHGDLHALM
jgi:hypothetical protein